MGWRGRERVERILAGAHRAARRGLPPRAFLRTGMVVVAGNALTAVLGVAALRIYTHLVAAQFFGTANLVLGVLALGHQLLVQPVNSTQLRYQTEANRNGEGDRFMAEVIRWSLAAAGLAAAFCILCLLVSREAASASMLAASACWIFGSALRNVLAARLHAEQRMTGYIALRVGEAALVVLATSVLLLLAPGATAFVWGQVAAFALVILVAGALAPWPVAGMLASSAAPIREGPPFRERLRRYGVPFVPLALLQWLGNMGDRYVLAAVLGPAAAGQYLAPFAIASRGFLIAGGIMTDLFRPRLFDAETHGEHARAKRVFLVWLGVCIATSLAGLGAVAVIGHWIVWLFLAPEYRAGAVAVMLWVGTGYSINGVSQALENRLLSLGYPATLLPPQGVGAVGNLVFALVLVPPNGVVGAAQANCLSFVLQCATTAAILWWKTAGRKGTRA